jgi:hypothetical protein
MDQTADWVAGVTVPEASDVNRKSSKVKPEEQEYYYAEEAALDAYDQRQDGDDSLPRFSPPAQKAAGYRDLLVNIPDTRSEGASSVSSDVLKALRKVTTKSAVERLKSLRPDVILKQLQELQTAAEEDTLTDSQLLLNLLQMMSAMPVQKQKTKADLLKDIKVVIEAYISFSSRTIVNVKGGIARVQGLYTTDEYKHLSEREKMDGLEYAMELMLTTTNLESSAIEFGRNVQGGLSFKLASKAGKGILYEPTDEDIAAGLYEYGHAPWWKYPTKRNIAIAGVATVALGATSYLRAIDRRRTPLASIVAGMGAVVSAASLVKNLYKWYNQPAPKGGLIITKD